MEDEAITVFTIGRRTVGIDSNRHIGIDLNIFTDQNAWDAFSIIGQDCVGALIRDGEALGLDVSVKTTGRRAVILCAECTVYRRFACSSPFRT